MRLKNILSKYYLVCLSIVLFPLDQLFTSVFPSFELSPFRILMVLLGLFVFQCSMTDFRELKHLLVLFFIYATLSFISVLWSRDMDISLLYTFQIVISLFFFMVAVSELCKRSEAIYDIAFFSCTIGAIISILALLGLFSQGIELSTENRLTFIGIGINTVSISIAYTSILGLFILLNKKEKKYKRILIILSELCIFFFLVRTGTRSSIFGLGIAVTIAYLLTYKISLKNVLKGLILFALLFFVFDYMISNFVDGKLHDRILAVGEDDIRSNSRGELWSVAFDWYLSNMLGTGAGNEFVAYATTESKEAHNLFISSLLQLGLLGFFFILACVAKVGFNCLKIKDHLLKFVAVSLYIFWVLQMMKGSFLQTRLFWIPMVLLCASFLLDKKAKLESL